MKAHVPSLSHTHSGQHAKLARELVPPHAVVSMQPTSLNEHDGSARGQTVPMDGGGGGTAPGGNGGSGGDGEGGLEGGVTGGGLGESGGGGEGAGGGGGCGLMIRTTLPPSSSSFAPQRQSVSMGRVVGPIPLAASKGQVQGRSATLWPWHSEWAGRQASSSP